MLLSDSFNFNSGAWPAWCRFSFEYVRLTQVANFIQIEMAPPTTPEKSGGKPRPGGNDDLIPLVIASHPGDLSLNYNKMKELDPQKRTYHALEHKFRKFKARAKEICDAEGGKALDVGKASVEKAGAKSPSSQHEDLIPLLIASIPGRVTLNFNRMKELDPHGRTASSFEHKFRKYKAAAKEILDADGGKATEDGGSSAKITPTPTPTKKRKTKGEGVKGESDNGKMTPSKKRRVVKRNPKIANAAGAKEENLGDEADHVNESAKEEPGAKASDDETEDAKLDAAVAKKRKPAAASKPRPRKKGLAIILKKEPIFVSETESDDEEKEDSVKATTTAAQPKPHLNKGLARIVGKEAASLSETESQDKEGEERTIKAKSARNGKRKAVVGADDDKNNNKKTEAAAANDKKSNEKATTTTTTTTNTTTTTEFLLTEAGVGGAIAGMEGVGEASAVPSKESAIRLLFE